MFNWLTALIIIILALFAFMGYKRGIIKMIVAIASIFATAFLVMLFQPKISGILKNTSYYNEVYGQVYSYSSEKIEDKIDAELINENIKVGYDTIEKVLDDIYIPNEIKGYVIEKIKIDTGDNINSGIENIKDIITKKIVDCIMEMLTFVVSFIVILVIVKIAIIFTQVISDLPVIGGVNKLCGLIVGLFEGICAVWIIFMVITVFGSLEIKVELFEMLNSNVILRFLYDSNIFMKIIL